MPIRGLVLLEPCKYHGIYSRERELVYYLGRITGISWELSGCFLYPDLFINFRGYVAPEYFMTGCLTYKADVYSFGIVLLEIVSGKRNTRMPMEGFTCVLDWVIFTVFHFIVIFNCKSILDLGHVLNYLK